MNLIHKEDFEQWVKGHHIRIEEGGGYGYPLVFDSKITHGRYWPVPQPAGATAFFFAKMLEGLDPWEKCWLWSDAQIWDLGSDKHARDTDQVLATIMRKMGIPEGFTGAIQYTRDEFQDVLTIFCSQVAYGWTVTNHIYVIPDDGKGMVFTNHCDDLVHAEFLDENRLQEYIRYLAKHDIKLPDKPPDASLKPEDWMNPNAN